MLFDLVQTLATLAHGRLGCVGDSVRTDSRSRRCRRAWAPHLAATREVVRAAIAGTARRDTAVVLGSGRLDDVPLATLCTSFARVLLVDAVHPLAARIRAAWYRDVTMIAADLSGSFSLPLARSLDLESPLPTLYGDPSVDLVISVNLLSQRPILPVARLEGSRRNLGRRRPEDGDKLGHAIVSRHLEALATPPRRRLRRLAALSGPYLALAPPLPSRPRASTGLVMPRSPVNALFSKRFRPGAVA